MADENELLPKTIEVPKTVKQPAPQISANSHDLQERKQQIWPFVIPFITTVIVPAVTGVVATGMTDLSLNVFFRPIINISVN